mgnify:CR=1 FL=1
MNTSKIDRYTLKQYTRLIISFFGCLMVLTIYQYTTLYFKGVVDTIFGASFFIALFHQLGFASLAGVILVFPFNFWENLRPKYGFNLVFVVLILLLILFFGAFLLMIIMPGRAKTMQRFSNQVMCQLDL